jgi:hypothetical protein
VIHRICRDKGRLVVKGSEDFNEIRDAEATEVEAILQNLTDSGTRISSFPEAKALWSGNV